MEQSKQLWRSTRHMNEYKWLSKRAPSEHQTYPPAVPQFGRDTCLSTISVGKHLRQTDEFQNSESIGARRIAHKTYKTWHWSSQQFAHNLILILGKWRRRSGSADAVKSSKLKDQKLALLCGATCVTGFTSNFPVWKVNLTSTTTSHVHNVQNIEFWLKMMITLQLQILRFPMPTQTLLTQRLLAVAKNCSKVLNAQPSMVIATWTRVKLTQRSNVPENFSWVLRLWVIGWMRFGPLIWLTCDNLQRKIQELGISSWQWIH